MVDCLDLSQELKNFKHNGVTLNLDERYVFSLLTILIARYLPVSD